jgi:hypothetical protein
MGYALPPPYQQRNDQDHMVDLHSLDDTDRGRIVSYCGQAGHLVGELAGWTPSIVYVLFRCEDWPAYPHWSHTFTCSAIYPEHLVWTRERALVHGSNGDSATLVHGQNRNFLRTI